MLVWIYVKAGARQIDMVHDARLKWIDRPRPVQCLARLGMASCIGNIIK